MSESLSFVVGEEKRVRELLTDSDVIPLFRGGLTAGATAVALNDPDGDPLWTVKDPARIGEPLIRLPLYLEGETVAILVVHGEQDRKEALLPCARLLGVALGTVLKNSLKRVLTTEIHTKVVNSSYEELLAANRSLAESEARYRELAENLELRVKEAGAELKNAYGRLLQQEKMAAVGQLAAGVAHEINNPLGFITSNLNMLQKYTSRMTTMLLFYREHLRLALPIEALVEAGERKWQELKLKLVLEDLADLLSQSLSGAQRVTRIVADLKGFSHIDEAGEQDVDLNAELERTVSVLSHVLSGAEVIWDLNPLPRVHCRPQLPGQIFLNLIQNAVNACRSGLRLTLSSAWDGERIRIGIADNGPGVPQEIRGRIFEPFFTTAPVGSGTGMGLTVVYDAVSGLGGTVAVSDAAGGGAEFTVIVPAVKE